MSDFVEVKTPDGRTVRFPKGMSRADMAAALNKLPSPQEKGMGQKVKEFFVGDDDPNTQNAGEKLGSFLNKAGESMTFGLIGDEASAAVESVLPGVDYETRRDHYRKQEEVLERDNPGLALGAEVGGALAGLATPMGAIGTLGRGAGIMPRVAASAAAGAGMAGTYGFMEGEGLDDRVDKGMDAAKWGGAIGAAAPVIGAGVQKFADDWVGRKAIVDAARGAPSSDALRAQGNAAYRAIDDANVQIKPEAFDRARGTIRDILRSNTGFDELPGPGSLTPNAARSMQIMDDAGARMAQEPTAALPFRSLDQMRRQAGAAAGNVANKTDQKAGVEIIQGLDDFVRNLGADDVVAGDVRTLQEMIPKARDIWSRMTKSQLVDDAIEAGQNNYLSGGSSGIRNQFARILRSDKLSRGFSEAERAAMRRVVNGTMPEQILNLLGGGLGQLGQIGAGFGIGGLPGALAGMATSAGARKASEAVSRRNAEIARALVASGKMNTLPVASDAARKISETLMRRGAAVANQ